jgi:hypothetical protein
MTRRVITQLQRDATPKSPSTARSARTRHTPRRPIRTHGSTAKAQDRARSCASSATFSWRTAAALWSDAELTRATGYAERYAALEMIKGVTGEDGTTRRITVGGDKSFDTADFVMELRELGAVPHVAQNTKGRRSAIDGRTTRHPGYAVSQRIRKRIEEVFGWTKTVAGQRKTRFRGLPNVCDGPSPSPWRPKAPRSDSGMTYTFHIVVEREAPINGAPTARQRGKRIPTIPDHLLDRLSLPVHVAI